MFLTGKLFVVFNSSIASKKSKYEDVCDLHVYADMSCLRIFIREQKRRISEICVEGKHVSNIVLTSI